MPSSSDRPTLIAAELTGLLTQQFVDDDAQVLADEQIGVLEVMKCEYTIVAPVAGTIKWHVGLQQFVSEGEPIAEIN